MANRRTYESSLKNYSFIAAATGADRVRFICIEADESHLPLLRRNTEGLDVAIHNVIAGPATEETRAALMRTGVGTSSIVAGDEARQVAALDDLVAGSKVDLIKIDTDGYEAQVLRGARKTLERGDAPCFIEFLPSHVMTYGKVAPATVIELLGAAGYGSGIMYDNFGYPMSLVEFSDAAIRGLVNYCLAKPSFYVDILAAKNHDLLTCFYDEDLPRYLKAH